MAKRGGKDAIDVEALHEFLWKHSDSKGKVEYSIIELTDLLGATYNRTFRVIDQMVKDGRLSVKKSRSLTLYCNNPNVYRVEHGITSRRK